MDIRCFTIFLFIVSATAMESLDPFRELKEKCRERMGLTGETKKSKGDALGAAAYLFCSALESNSITKDGLLNGPMITDVVEPVVPGPMTSSIIEMCNTEAMLSGAKTRIERIVVLSRCLREKLEPMLRDLEGLLKQHEQRL